MWRPLLEGAPGRVPWLCGALLLLWGVAGVGNAVAGGLLAERLGASSAGGAFPSVLTAIWLHGSGLHLFSSVLLFAVAAPQLEARWGPGAFGGALLLWMLAAFGVDRALYADLPTSWVGPTPLLAGVVAAATVRGWSTGLGLRIGPANSSRDLALPVLVLPPVWLLASIVLDAQAPLAGPVAAHGFAPAGVAAGLGVAVALGLSFLDWEQRRARAPGKTASPLKKTLKAAAAARAEGRPGDAYDTLDRALTGDAADAPVIEALWDAAAECQRQRDAQQVASRFVLRALEQNQPDLAARIWARIASTASLSLPLATRFALADRLVAAGDPRAAAATLGGAMRVDAAQLSAGAALRIAETVEPLHGATAIEALRWVLAHATFEGPKRQKLEAWIARIEADPKHLEEAPLDAPAGERPAAAPPAPPPIDPDDIDLGSDDALGLDDRAPGNAETPSIDPHALDLAPEGDGDSLDLAEPGSTAGTAPTEDARGIDLDGALDPGDSASIDLAEPGSDSGDALPNESGLDPAELDSFDPGDLSNLELDAGDGLAAAPPAQDAFTEFRFPSAKIVNARVQGLQAGQLHLQSPSGKTSRLATERISGLAWARVSDAPVLDALLNWNDAGQEPLRIVRLTLPASEEKPMLDRLRALAEALLATGAVSAVTSFEGTPPSFASLGAYQRELLGVAEAGSPDPQA